MPSKIKEKPIIFSTEMVTATLDDRKTQTRRVIKPQPDSDGFIHSVTNTGKESLICVHDKGLSPYSIGDILWVQETWCKEFYAPIGESESVTEFLNKIEFRICYKATDALPDNCSWKPSIHMPREAARIFLRVTDVRCERLQEISGHDVMLEGLNRVWYNGESERWENEQRLDYKKLWNSLNAKRGYSWESNPWVWVYEFERIENYERTVT
jgi:hypothetical protein